MGVHSTSKKIHELVQLKLRETTKRFIGSQFNEQILQTAKKSIIDTLSQCLSNYIIPKDAVTVSHNGNGILDVDINLPPNMLPPFYPQYCLIGIASNNHNMIRCKTLLNAEQLAIQFNDVYKTDTSQLFDDAYHSYDKDDFLSKGLRYGTVFLFCDGCWYIQDNNNYDRKEMVKLSTYLLLK